jgi:hypothetical protein
MAVAITEETSRCLTSLQPLWHAKAPLTVVESCPGDDPASGWRVWQEHLRTRTKPAPPAFVAKKKSPLLWGWPPDWERDSIQANLGTPTALAELMIGDDSTAAPDLPLSLQIVALSYAMPQLARELPAETWWQLIERLHAIAVEAQTPRINWPAEPHDVLRQQLLAGELPLALGNLFPELQAIRALRDAARAALSEAIIELTDGQGLPDVRLFPVLGPLFACWTRTRWIGSRLKRGPWSRKAELQYQWLVRHAIRLADKDGRFLLTPPEPVQAWNKKLFKTAIQLAGDEGDRAAAAAALPRGVLPKKNKLDASERPDPSLNSDWAGVTIMAGGWSQADPRLAVAFANNPMTIELSVAGRPLIRGPWIVETSCDGDPVHITGEWEQLCWESDKRFDLLELGLELSHGLRLERQLLFGRQDRILYLADMIISSDRAAHSIRHAVALPLVENTLWRPETETRDGMLCCQGARAAVLPLALHEWRCDPRGGTLENHDGRLVLTQETSGAALCCPLLLDLNPIRAKASRTWRQLTVGENLEVVPRDVAASFRVQSGDDQWLFYRSLGPVGNRTFLGQNTAGEFSAGRFFSTGEYKEWIEIDAV